MQFTQYQDSAPLTRNDKEPKNIKPGKVETFIRTRSERPYTVVKLTNVTTSVRVYDTAKT